MSATSLTDGEKFILLLAEYPAHDGASNRAMFHERMERYAAKLEVEPLDFDNGFDGEMLNLFDLDNDKGTNLIVCGEAGDGKTRMLHKLQRHLGDATVLRKEDTCWMYEYTSPTGTHFRVHFNRDLSASRKFGATIVNSSAERDRIALYSALILGKEPERDIRSFCVVAANDGQLLNAWDDHAKECKDAADALAIIREALNNGGAAKGAPVRVFHLSGIRTEELFEKCMDAVLKHPGWKVLEEEHSGRGDIFAKGSHLRRGYDALRDDIVRGRLLDIARLCGANDWRLPVRKILALLANALLGTTNRKIAPSGVMNLEQLKSMATEPQLPGDFFASVLGLNIDPGWREKTLGPIESFRIGYETWNPADELILFGPDDGQYRADHTTVFKGDKIFEEDDGFDKLRERYLNTGPSSDSENTFHETLVAQRRRLFFRIPPDIESRYDPWRLTNFHHAREFLLDFLLPIAKKEKLDQRKLRDLILGLNRVWTGLLLEDHDRLFLSTALDLASAPSCEIKIAEARRGSPDKGVPCVALEAPEGVVLPRISVYVTATGKPAFMDLNLSRFEFLKRVADGALPASFSRECSEDIKAFKSRVLALLGPALPSADSIEILRVNADGRADPFLIHLEEGA